MNMIIISIVILVISSEKEREGAQNVLKWEHLFEIKCFRILKQYFDTKDIVKEKKFDDMKDLRKLRLEFYIPSINLAIEVNDKKHYKISREKKLNGESPEDYCELIGDRYNLKVEYLKQHKIPLIEIPFWEFDNMKSFLDEKLKPYIQNK